MSIGIYVLAALQRSSSHSQEAGFKYLILGAFASAFLLYGIALIYGTTGTTQLHLITARMGGNAAMAANPVFWAGWGLLVVGLGFKIAMVPFHQWTPDVYAGAPAPVTGFMAAGVKAAAFALLLRVVWAGMPMLQDKMQPLLFGFAILTMSFGNLVALAQSTIKRMLAYSAIAHAGYLLVGILAVGPESHDPATRGILFYLAVYALTNVGAFAVVTFVSRGSRERADLHGFAGMARRHPFVSFFLTVCMLSLAGVPPTAGFWGKFYVFGAAIQKGLIGISIVALLNSAVAAYYYLRVIVYLYMREPGDEAYIGDDMQASAAMCVAALLLLWIGIFPSSVAELARLGAAALARGF
jgi:NADH-quinone oxidoreductase subunit N